MVVVVDVVVFSCQYPSDWSQCVLHLAPQLQSSSSCYVMCIYWCVDNLMEHSWRCLCRTLPDCTPVIISEWMTCLPFEWSYSALPMVCSILADITVRSKWVTSFVEVFTCYLVAATSQVVLCQTTWYDTLHIYIFAVCVCVADIIHIDFFQLVTIVVPLAFWQFLT